MSWGEHNFITNLLSFMRGWLRKDVGLLAGMEECCFSSGNYFLMGNCFMDIKLPSSYLGVRG